MPHAKIDVAFVREHFAAVPEKTRPAAIALYLELVVTSAELLLDGMLPVQVVLAGAHEIGISRGRYGRSEVQKIGTSLASAGLVEMQENDVWHLVYWADHHNALDYVEGRRKSDADRKREKRGQLTIGGEGEVVHTARPPNVRSGHREDSRAHARRRSASESEDHSSSSTSRPPGAALPGDDDDQLEHDLEHLGVNGPVLRDALADPTRARAWISYTAEHAHGNAAGYFATSFTTGAWPPSNGTTTIPTSQTDPTERRERWLRDYGWRYTDDTLLQTQLEDMGADTDERIGLLDLAHDLRRQSVST